jgi:hypothetical protein
MLVVWNCFTIADKNRSAYLRQANGFWTRQVHFGGHFEPLEAVRAVRVHIFSFKTVFAWF